MFFPRTTGLPASPPLPSFSNSIPGGGKGVLTTHGVHSHSPSPTALVFQLPDPHLTLTLFVYLVYSRLPRTTAVHCWSSALREPSRPVGAAQEMLLNETDLRGAGSKGDGEPLSPHFTVPRGGTPLCLSRGGVGEHSCPPPCSLGPLGASVFIYLFILITR